MTDKKDTKNYTKKEMVDLVAKKSGLKKYESEKALDAVIESIKDVLKSGDSVNFIGFGKFSVAEIAPRKGRNPKTGESMDIPASKKPRFHAGKQLKEVFNL